MIIPRFMNDQQLRSHFGISQRALQRLRATGYFPSKDALIGKTDRRAVDRYFDTRAGIPQPPYSFASDDGQEHWGDKGT